MVATWILVGIAAIGAGVGIWKAIDDHQQKEEQLEQQQQQIALQEEQQEIEEEKLQNEVQQTALQEQQLGLDYEKAYTDALKSLGEYDVSIDSTKLSLKENEGELSSYEKLLERWQGNYNYKMAENQATAYQTYKQLVDNWSASEVTTASRGQSGRTALALAANSNMQLKQYLGEDMRLNSAEEMASEGFDFDKNGGLLGMAWRDLHLDLLADKTTYETKIKDLTGAIDTTKKTLSTTTAAMGEALKSASGLAEKAGKTDTEYIDQLKEKYGVQ